MGLLDSCCTLVALRLAVIASAAGRLAAPDLSSTALQELDVEECSGSSQLQTFPLLSPETCAAIIAAAEGHAARAGGWLTDRHGNYATTDLEVRAVPQLLALLEPFLPAASAIALASLEEGAALASGGELEFHDLFVVRYDQNGQRSLGMHEDGSRVTLQVALNDPNVDFTGGGTFFQQLQCKVQPGVGEALVFRGDVRHAGLEIFSGRRYVLVGFSKHASSSEEEGEHLHISFGQGAFNVTLGGEMTPCVEHETSAMLLRAHVSWRGCAGDSFGVSSRSKEGTQKGERSLGMLWIERHAAANCAQEVQERWLNVPAVAAEPLATEPKDCEMLLLALPPGHDFVSYNLRPCSGSRSSQGLAFGTAALR
eukprot:TRINITY_DN68453_c0_g1_i1.p1 TRINITY_DN68453_c0_g1~~TRINITY_DN68453_c0_g1_i1.p1  ORF type:complete len:379 (+),score=90.50 TRINITY_DN68453_c0_g1_i1:36-1139(+)